MSVTGRTLSSVSQSPATGLHSAALVPGLGVNAQFTVFMAFKDPGGNTNNTIWADDNGGCQFFINSSTGRVSARYASSTVTAWAAEAAAFVARRDSVWQAAYALLAEVQAGARAAPSPAEAVAEIPDISWPEGQ